MKAKLTIEYHGGEFVGWQFQPQQRSVESELSKALQTTFAALAKKSSNEFTSTLGLSASGRTDSGVHARGQVVSFPWPQELACDPEEFLWIVNKCSGRDLSVRSLELVEDSFDARKSPHTKCYKYFMYCSRFPNPLLIDRTWLVPPSCDVALMEEVAELYLGTHDFTQFRSRDASTKTSIRTLEKSSIARPEENLVVYETVGKGFLKNMVRILVGAMVQVSCGRMSIAEVNARLRDPRGERGEATLLPRAPAQGLVLDWVRYAESEKYELA